MRRSWLGGVAGSDGRRFLGGGEGICFTGGVRVYTVLNVEGKGASWRLDVDDMKGYRRIERWE